MDGNMWMLRNRNVHTHRLLAGALLLTASLTAWQGRSADVEPAEPAATTCAVNTNRSDMPSPEERIGDEIGASLE